MEADVRPRSRQGRPDLPLLREDEAHPDIQGLPGQVHLKKNPPGQEMRAVLEELTPQERAWSDGELTRQFLQHPKVAQAQTILAYWGVGTEVDTRPILEALLAQGKRVCLPRCLPESFLQP